MAVRAHPSAPRATIGEPDARAAARAGAIPLSSLPLVEGLLDDLILEGAIAAYGDALFSKRRTGRKVVAVDVGEDDLIELLSKGHRVLELK